MWVDKGAENVVPYWWARKRWAHRNGPGEGRMDERKVHTMEKKTTNTNKTNTTTNAAALWAGPDRLPVREMVMTALEYIQAESITVPAYQRGDVWDATADKRLLDSMLRGLPLPNVILVEVIDQGKRLLLLVDGLQRRLSVGRAYYGLLAVADDPDAAHVVREEARHMAEYIAQAPIRATVVTADVSAAALLFARLNAGRPLKAAERGRAALPEAVLEGLRPWEAWYSEAMGGASRIGGTTVIAAAMCLAAAHVAAPGKATSSGATAARQLAAYKGPIPAPDAKALGVILEGIQGMAPGARTGGAWALAPSRLTPLYLAVREGAVSTAAGVRYVLAHVLDVAERAEAVRDSSSGPKATTARLKAIRDTAAQYRRGKAQTQAPEEPEVAAARESLLGRLAQDGEEV